MTAILLNIGNTHTEQALWRKGGLEQIESVPTALLIETGGRLQLLARFPKRSVLAACVVPEAATVLRLAWSDRPLRFLTPQMAPFPDFSQVDASTIGADRVANAIGVLCVAEPPVIVLDAGTATTTEVIDSDGTFRGGAIAPGRRLLRGALHLGTAQLPEIPIETDCPNAVGTNTADAIRAGVDVGFLGMIEKILGETRRHIGVLDCPVLATGGDREFCLRNIPDIQPAPPHLALLGLARIAADVFRPGQ